MSKAIVLNLTSVLSLIHHTASRWVGEILGVDCGFRGLKINQVMELQAEGGMMN